MSAKKNSRFSIEFSSERIISPSGLAIIGGMLGKSDLVKRLNRIPVDEKKRSEPQIKNGDIALTYIGLLAQGKTDYDAVKEMADDPEFFRDALGIVRAIPSAETLRQRMDDMGDSRRKDILQGLHTAAVTSNGRGLYLHNDGGTKARGPYAGLYWVLNEYEHRGAGMISIIHVKSERK